MSHKEFHRRLISLSKDFSEMDCTRMFVYENSLSSFSAHLELIRLMRSMIFQDLDK